MAADSVWFAVLAAWLPMVLLGTASHVHEFALPEPVHRLRAFEIDGRLYERLGVRLVKRLLRRGPATWFNPGLRLPARHDADALARLERRMRTAEASHLVAFALTAGVAVHAAARGWWTAAAVTAALDIALNAYPVMLQRYNRAWLTRMPGATPHAGDRG